MVRNAFEDEPLQVLHMCSGSFKKAYHFSRMTVRLIGLNAFHPMSGASDSYESIHGPATCVSPS